MADGVVEIMLLGQNVNSYRFERDGQTVTFPMLLRTVAEAVPEMRVRFTTSHPKDMSDETLHVIAEVPNVCKHIHLPDTWKVFPTSLALLIIPVSPNNAFMVTPARISNTTIVTTSAIRVIPACLE